MTTPWMEEVEQRTEQLPTTAWMQEVEPSLEQRSRGFRYPLPRRLDAHRLEQRIGIVQAIAADRRAHFADVGHVVGAMFPRIAERGRPP